MAKLAKFSGWVVVNQDHQNVTGESRDFAEYLAMQDVTVGGHEWVERTWIFAWTQALRRISNYL